MSLTKQQEQAQNQFFSDLLEVAENGARGGLNVPHAVFVGIEFFAQMALDCAPNTKEGKKLIKDAIKYALKKHAYMLSQKEDIDAYKVEFADDLKNAINESRRNK